MTIIIKSIFLYATYLFFFLINTYHFSFSQSNISINNLKPTFYMDSTNIDYGYALNGVVAKPTFTISNHGNQDLIIEIMKIQCDCCIASLSSPIINPGATITVDTWCEHRKHENWEIIIQTNDPMNKYVKIDIKLDYREPFWTVPQKIDFDTAQINQLASSQFELYTIPELQHINKENSYLFYPTIQSISCGSENIEIKKIRTEFSKNAKKIIYNVYLNTSTKLGFIQDNITILTNSKRIPMIDIPIVAYINSLIKVKPKLISFGIVNYSQSIKKNLLLEGNEKTIQNLKITCEDSSISAKLLKGTIQNNWIMEVTLNPSQITGVFKSNIVLSNQNNVPLAKIPVSAYIQK